MRAIIKSIKKRLIIFLTLMVLLFNNVQTLNAAIDNYDVITEIKNFLDIQINESSCINFIQ